MQSTVGRRQAVHMRKTDTKLLKFNDNQLYLQNGRQPPLWREASCLSWTLHYTRDLFCQQLVTSFRVKGLEHKHPLRFRLWVQIEMLRGHVFCWNIKNLLVISSMLTVSIESIVRTHNWVQISLRGETKHSIWKKCIRTQACKTYCANSESHWLLTLFCWYGFYGLDN